MSMGHDFVEHQDFEITNIYVVFLLIILVVSTVENFLLLYMLHLGHLTTVNITLRTLVSVQIIAGIFYVWFACTREAVFMGSYATRNQIYLENYFDCGFFYWVASAFQYTVAFMLMGATVKRILSIRHKSFHSVYVHLRSAAVYIGLSIALAFALNLHYFCLKIRDINVQNTPTFRQPGTHQVCMPEPDSGYEAFWKKHWIIMDAVFHVILPGIVLVPTHVAIEHFFYKDMQYLLSLPPREKNKMRYKRARDTVFIKEQGWTRAILYSGVTFLVCNAPINGYLWYNDIEKYYAMFHYNHFDTKGFLFGLELLKFVPHLMWFPIFYLSGCDGRKVVPKKTISMEILPMRPSHYSLRSRASKSHEEGQKEAEDGQKEAEAPPDNTLRPRASRSNEEKLSTSSQTPV